LRFLTASYPEGNQAKGPRQYSEPNLGIREFQPGYRDFLQKQRSPATGGTSGVAGLTFVMFTAGPAPAGQPFAGRAPAGPGAPTGGLTEASAPDIIDTLISPRAHHNLTTEGLRDADHYER
jgi:hypothetical protein